MTYEIYETYTFTMIFNSVTEKERDWIRKMKEQIKINPKTGKALHFDWFREKKFENKRLYFIVSIKKPRVLGSWLHQEDPFFLHHLLEMQKTQ